MMSSDIPLLQGGIFIFPDLNLSLVGEILAYVQNRSADGLKVKMIIAFLMIFELPDRLFRRLIFFGKIEGKKHD